MPREAEITCTGSIGIGGADDEAHHLAAEILLGDDAVGIEFVIGVHRDAAPDGGRIAQRAVGEHIGMAVIAARGNDDADLVGALVVAADGARRIDRDDDAAAASAIGELGDARAARCPRS